MSSPMYSAAPESELSMLIKRELGIDIDKAALRIFIRANWRTVQGLAHAIHGTKPCQGEDPAA